MDTEVEYVTTILETHGDKELSGVGRKGFKPAHYYIHQTVNGQRFLLHVGGEPYIRRMWKQYKRWRGGESNERT